MEAIDLGDLLLAIAVLMTTLIVIFECAERRREGKRERLLLDAIEREYRLYYRLGRF
jgi:hypothetical protein